MARETGLEPAASDCVAATGSSAQDGECLAVETAGGDCQPAENKKKRKTMIIFAIKRGELKLRGQKLPPNYRNRNCGDAGARRGAGQQTYRDDRYEEGREVQ